MDKVTRMKYEYKLRQFKCSICGITFVIESDTDIPDMDRCPDCKGKRTKKEKV